MNTTKQLYQWDINQMLVDCTGLYVDFPVNGEIYRAETKDGECLIPDEFLQVEGRQKIWECMPDCTRKEFVLEIKARPMPPDYAFTPTEKLTFDGLVKRVDDAIADMIRRADSGEFDGYTPVKGKDYFTADEIKQIQEEVSSGAVGDFKSVVDTETETFNINAETKLNEFNVNAESNLTEYNGNATEKLNAYNSNAEIKVTEYNQNDTNKTAEYNSNAETKIDEYNTNANNRVAEFDSHTEQIQTDISGLKNDLTEFKDGFANLNLWENVELYAENMYVSAEDGHIITQINDAYNTYIIKIDGTKKYTFGSSVKDFRIRIALPLASDKYTATGSIIEYFTTIDCTEYPNTEYLAFSFDKDIFGTECVISEGTDAKEGFALPNWYASDVNGIKTDVTKLTSRVDAMSDNISKGVVSKNGTFSASGDNILLSSARSNLRKGIRLVFEATVTSGTDFEIGFSISGNDVTTYTHDIITVDNTNITYNNTSYPHGLNIIDRLQMIFEYLSDGTADITLLCNGNSFKQNVPFVMYSVAIPYVKSNGLIATDCKLTFICTDIRKKIWCFGDSYFSYSASRWTYYLKEYGYDTNVLLDGFPGMSSVNGRASFAKLLNLGTPKIAVWFMGMNDGTDADDTTPNPEWATEKDKFITLCEANDIEPIFATIPNVPSIRHNGKNAWIKSSGYRYIDMCHAVGADVDVNWYGEMLSSDRIHPAESGAKALFAQVLLDLPEVMLNNL